MIKAYSGLSTVVADEIRTLADQSSAGAPDCPYCQIAGGMEEQSQAKRGLLKSVGSMRSHGDAIHEFARSEAKTSPSVLEFLEQLVRLSQEISSAKAEEAIGMEELNRSTTYQIEVAAEVEKIAEDLNFRFGTFTTREWL